MHSKAYSVKNVNVLTLPTLPTADSSTLWMAGGLDENYNILASSEFIQENQTMPGPELPVPIYSHVLVNIQSDTTIQIGGFSPLEFGLPDMAACCKKVYIYQHKLTKWNLGPNLIQGRVFHSAGLVTDETTGEKLVTVTGGTSGNGDPLKSTEIMSLGRKWSKGIFSILQE